jgi:hypothetical protein
MVNMQELSDDQYNDIENQVRLVEGDEAANDFFDNTLAYLTPTMIILRDNTALAVNSPDEIAGVIMDMIEEEGSYGSWT